MVPLAPFAALEVAGTQNASSADELCQSQQQKEAQRIED